MTTTSPAPEPQDAAITLDPICQLCRQPLSFHVEKKVHHAFKGPDSDGKLEKALEPPKSAAQLEAEQSPLAAERRFLQEPGHIVQLPTPVPGPPTDAVLRQALLAKGILTDQDLNDAASHLQALGVQQMQSIFRTFNADLAGAVPGATVYQDVPKATADADASEPASPTPTKSLGRKPRDGGDGGKDKRARSVAKSKRGGGASR